MRILFVSPRQCWPAISGAKLREYHFARALGDHWSLSYVFFKEPRFDLPTRNDLPFCDQIIPVEPPKFYSTGRLIRGLIGRWPLPVVNYTSAEMEQAIRKAISGGPFDAVHFDSINMAAYGPLVKNLLPKAEIFFNWHNIESEGMRRFAGLTKSRAKAWYAKRTASRLESVEKELLGQYGNVVCSEREQQQLRQLAPQARVAVVENGVDTTYFDDFPAAANRHRILFVGLMSYYPNIDGIVWFAHHIWPRLRDRLPGKTLTIVGAKPDPAVLALQSEQGIEVTGTVPDVRPFYSEAFAAIAPLRTGAGTRLKILEAMAAGVPVISTGLGAEGLEISPGRDILLADDDADEWSNGFSLLSDEAYRNRMIEAGLHLARSRYDWPLLRKALVHTYSEWIGRPK